MAYSSSAVKPNATTALHTVAIRTLRTLAHYTVCKRQGSQTRRNLASTIEQHWQAAPYRQLVRRSLTAADRALLQAWWRGEQPLPTPQELDLWRWQAPWPALEQLSSGQRLAVLGLVLPIRTTMGRKVVLINDTSRWLRRTPALPPTPVATSFQALFQTVVALVAACANTPQPRHAAGLALHVAHAAGWLAYRLEQWRITPRGRVWLHSPIDEQQRLLQQQLITCNPPASGLVAWRSPDWAALFADLERLMQTQAQRRSMDVAALLHDHPAWNGLAADQQIRLLHRWLRSILQPAGVVSLAKGWLFWHGWQSLIAQAPAFDGLLLPKSAELPAALQVWGASWGLATSHGWRITQASVAAALANGLDLSSFWQPIDQWYAERPALLQALIEKLQHQPRLRQITLLEGSPEALASAQANWQIQAYLQPGFNQAQRVVCHGAEHAVAKVLGLNATPAPRLDNHISMQILALRIAAQHLPSHRLDFNQQAQQLIAELSFEQRCMLDEDWECLQLSVAPDPLASSQALAIGQQPQAQLTVEQTRQACRQALNHQQTLTVRYYTPAEHRITTRTIRPLELTSTGIRGWCELRQQERAFRFDRILAIEINSS
ncbi:WYL domain-containing protein [Herpetosiphon gulosus]|uniref:WYL domain-containing protein n=1 Tax=Herpetosiphon gulosus TaxID=1973496 RepID=A0ABP9WYQ6_9CHLR